MPDLSVVVPALHYRQIDRVTASLLAQEAPGCEYEVIVSDNAGAWEDGVRRAQEQVPGVSVVYVKSVCEGLWRSRALNAGIEVSSGKIVVLLAGDFTPGAGFVAAHWKFHSDHPPAESVAIGPSRFVA